MTTIEKAKGGSGSVQWARDAIIQDMARHLHRSGADVADRGAVHTLLIADGWSEQAVDELADVAAVAAERLRSEATLEKIDRARAELGRAPYTVLVIVALLFGVGAIRTVVRATNKAAWDAVHAQQMEATLWWK